MDLKSLLKRYKENQDKIEKLLGIGMLVVLVIFTVNYFRNNKPNSSNTDTTIPGESTETSEKLNTHTVTKGETLWSISEKYYKTGYKWSDIAKENKLVNPNSIEAGQVIKLPVLESVQNTQTDIKPVQNDGASKNTSAISGSSYTVVKGDNLWKIAVRAYGDGYQWAKIAEANKLVHPNIIHSGNVLVIPQ